MHTRPPAHPPPPICPASPAPLYPLLLLRRLGTATADVPAKLGDRITVVCAPQRTSSPLAARRLLGTAPHGTKPEEPLSVSNHTTRGDTPALRAPAAAAAGGLPSWAVPAAVLLAGGDAASALIDPALPLIVAGAVAGTLATGGWWREGAAGWVPQGATDMQGSTVQRRCDPRLRPPSVLVCMHAWSLQPSLRYPCAAGVAGNSLLLPRLKQLPERVLEVPAARQKLLAQVWWGWWWGWWLMGWDAAVQQGGPGWGSSCLGGRCVRGGSRRDKAGQSSGVNGQRGVRVVLWRYAVAVLVHPPARPLPYPPLPHSLSLSLRVLPPRPRRSTPT